VGAPSPRFELGAILTSADRRVKRQTHGAYHALCWALAPYCRVPDPLASFEDYQRHSHRDLADASPGALRSELASLNLILSLPALRDPWLLERRQQLQRVLGKARIAPPQGLR
jgi:hypothetical protein